MINNCETTNKHTRFAILERYQRNKRAVPEDGKKNGGKVEQVIHIPTKSHSSTFKASFAKEAIPVDIMADQGGDANFIFAQLLKRIREKLPNITTETLVLSQVYRGVTGKQRLTCQSTVELDVHISTTHGTRLMLGNVVWKATEEHFKTPVLARRVLESLGGGNREMLLASRDKFGHNVYIEERFIDAESEKKRDGTIAVLYGESVFYQAGRIGDDSLKL